MKLFRIKAIITIFIFSITLSCEKVEKVEDPYPISEIEFTFLQASNKVYISVKALKGYQGFTLDSILVLWQGTSISDNADTLKLLDDGTMGDLISKDEIFTRKINNDITNLKNIIPLKDADSVFLSILGVYNSKLLEISSAFILGNRRPIFLSVSAPDTVNKPTKNEDGSINADKYYVKAKVEDPNGPDDLKRVFFRSYHVGLDSMMNGGNPILLFDDGGGDEGSGDAKKSDGEFTRLLSIPFSAETGTYYWTFEAQDISNAYSTSIKRTLIVQ